MDNKEFILGLLLNWKTLLPLVGLLGSTSAFNGCQWSYAETRADNEKAAAMYLAENMLTSGVQKPVNRKPQIIDCNCTKLIERINKHIDQNGEHVR